MFFTRFSELCEEKHKTTTGVGVELGIPRGTISYWKHSNAVPKQDVLKSIAEYFGVTVDYLLGNEKKTAQTDGLEKEFADIIQQLTEENSAKGLDYLKYLLNNQ